MILKQVFYIYYLIQFKKNKLKNPINLGSKVNIIILTNIVKLSLKIYFINIKAQKIDGFIFKMFEIVLVGLYIKDKFGWT